MLKKPIPEFKSDEEFSDFVNQNDMTEYDWQETEEIQIERVPKKAVNLRLHPYVLNNVKKIAAARKMPYSTLIQQWLAERVAQEKVLSEHSAEIGI